MDHSLSVLLCFYLYFSVWPLRIMVDHVCSLLSVNDICLFRIYRVNAYLTVWFSFVFIEIKYYINNFSCMEDARVFYSVCASWLTF